MKPNVLFAFGILLAAVVGFGVWRTTQRPAPAPVAGPSKAMVETRPVVVATEEVPLGAVLEAKHLKVVEWPASVVPRGAIPAVDPLLGRVVMARLSTNEPLVEERLAPKGTHGLLPLIIEQGMRAVTVRVNEVTAVGGFIVPGSRVDVLVTTKVESDDAAGETTAKNHHRTHTLLQNLTVLALGQVLEAATEPVGGKSLSTATLLATPGQAELLALASNSATLQLVLRGFADTVPTESAGKGTNDLFSFASTAPDSFSEVELIKGAERLTVRF